MSESMTIWLLACARCASMALVVPMVAHHVMSWWLRGAVVAVLCLALLAHESPLSWGASEVEAHATWRALGAELALGVAVGTALAVSIIAAKMIGQVLGQLAGFAWDPNDSSAEEPLPSARFMGFLALVIFIGVGGPELAVGALLDSYQTMPVGKGIQEQTMLNGLIEIMRQGFRLAVTGVGPAVACWLIVQAAFGLVQRLAPQLGFFQFGFQANLLVFWLSLLLTAVGAAWLFEREIATAFKQIVGS